MMNTDALYLHDIRGLDAIPWWPLAPGWWFVAGVCLVLLTVVAIRLLIRRDPAASRYRDARRRLRILRRRVRKDSVKDIASSLSELLRRIAMLRATRQDCAGLSGESWLEWLKESDPNGFDWVGRGELLLVVPYAPEGSDVKRRELRKLIDAALGWVDTSQKLNRPQPRAESDTAPAETASV